MANPSNFFAGRVAVLATMHRKERAIAPVLESSLGVKVIVPQGFDTDGFGTFTGDIERPADQRTTARLKATAALKYAGETLAIASEGSFGPHPQIPFVPCDRELVLLLDRQHQLEIVGEALSTETNYRSQTIYNLEEALAFAYSIGFPTHGVVVRSKPEQSPEPLIIKGIITENNLETAVRRVLGQSASRDARIETDMRALYNPTRMQVITQAAENLVQAATQCCPQCSCPGFNIVKWFPGLPCSVCGSPTLLTLSMLYQCQQCRFQQIRSCEDKRSKADPSHCSYCNP